VKNHQLPSSRSRTILQCFKKQFHRNLVRLFLYYFICHQWRPAPPTASPSSGTRRRRVGPSSYTSWTPDQATCRLLTATQVKSALSCSMGPVPRALGKFPLMTARQIYGSIDLRLDTSTKLNMVNYWLYSLMH
jgi:hypothetical protein